MEFSVEAGLENSMLCLKESCFRLGIYLSSKLMIILILGCFGFYESQVIQGAVEGQGLP
jgi:hypothetical protein